MAVSVVCPKSGDEQQGDPPQLFLLPPQPWSQHVNTFLFPSPGALGYTRGDLFSTSARPLSVNQVYSNPQEVTILKYCLPRWGISDLKVSRITNLVLFHLGRCYMLAFWTSKAPRECGVQHSTYNQPGVRGTFFMHRLCLVLFFLFALLVNH